MGEREQTEQRCSSPPELKRSLCYGNCICGEICKVGRASRLPNRTADGPRPQHAGRPRRSGKVRRLRPDNLLRTGTVRGPTQAGPRTVPVRSAWAGQGALEKGDVFRPDNLLRTGTV